MKKETGVETQAQYNDVLRQAVECAQRYVRDTAERRVGPSEAAVAALAGLHEPFPELPTNPGEVIARLDEIGSAATVATIGAR